MEKLHSLALVCTRLCALTSRSLQLKISCSQSQRHGNLLHFKRYKHLCRSYTTTQDLRHKLISPNRNFYIWRTTTSLNCPSIQKSRSAAQQTAPLSISSVHSNDNKSDDILKDDPFFKDLLREIREDFSSYSGTSPPAPGTNNSETKTVGENDDKIKDKNKSIVDESSSDSDYSLSASDSDSSEEERDSSSDTETGHSGKLSKEQGSTTELDLDIGGFISLDQGDDFEEVEEFPDSFEPDRDPAWESPIDLKRGVTGVFDVEELVVLLKADNAKDVCVIRMPDHLRLGDYLVIVTASSYRHMKAMAKDIVHTYKLKKHPSDRFPLVSGVDEGQWAAFDLGNIILHVFKAEVREMYDLETLWTVGPQFDEKNQELVNPYVLEHSDMDWLKEFYQEKEELQKEG